MAQKILVISGRKESGKNTIANYIEGYLLKSLNKIDSFTIDNKGKLVIQAEGDYSTDIKPWFRQYAFADDLKQLCINILGLTHEQCYGNNDQKNTITKYKWENMPGLSETEFAGKSGVMKAREVMQYVGTNIFREMYSDIWVEACLNRIQKEASELAVVTDCRFPNEVYGSQRRRAHVIRLTRNPNPTDDHSSEISLDKDRFDWDRFDAIIDNENMSIKESCYAVRKQLAIWGWL